MPSAQSSTRSRILERGTDLLSATGLSGVTLGVLADQAGLSKSGLFAHFRNKAELDLALLEHTATLAKQHVIEPALAAPEGLPRLQALVQNWLGWSTRAGLSGGCAVAAGMFELDDGGEGPVRQRLLQMEAQWRGLLGALARRALELGQLRRGTDIEQLVWELCGIYLSHHVSRRFVKDPKSDQYAAAALAELFERSKPERKRISIAAPRTRTGTKRKEKKS